MAVKKFEILEHTGDAKIRVFGETKKELFLNAMLGMRDLVKPKLKIKNKTVKRTTKIISADLNALLVDFLSEVNYLSQTNKEAYDDAKFLKFGDSELEAELSGQEVESFGEEIKAVTHHGLEIRQKKNGTWETAILFDI